MAEQNRDRLLKPARSGAIWLFVLLTGAAYASAETPVQLMSQNATHTGSANDGSFKPKWDDAGRFAIFESDATDLVAGLTGPAFRQVYLHDRASGNVTLISHAAGSPLQAGNGNSIAVQLSADGEYALYASLATDLVTGQFDTNATADYFLWRRATGLSQLVTRSTASATTTSSGLAEDATLNADGRFVFFSSAATDLPGVTVKNNACSDVYRFDRTIAAVTLVSRIATSATTTTNGCSSTPSVSSDGKIVAFQTSGTDLIAGVTDVNGTDDDVYVIDLNPAPPALLRLISRHAATTTANNASFEPLVCPDGSCVTFRTFASDIEGVALDSNGTIDAFLHDRPSNSTVLVSRKNTSATTTASNSARLALPNEDGKFVVLVSDSTNHVAGQVDTNADDDIFLFDRSGVQSVVRLVTHLPGLPTQTGAGINNGASDTQIALDGTLVLYRSPQNDLVSGTDTNGTSDVFVWHRRTGRNRLVSHAITSAATAGNGRSDTITLARRGLVAGFESIASNLVTGDTNGSVADAFFASLPLFEDDFETSDLSAWVVGP